jgi:hypothetical protein
MTRARRSPDPGDVPDPRAVPDPDGVADPRTHPVARKGNEAGDGAEDQSPQREKSGYDAAPPGRPGPQPLKTRIELVLVSGPEGKQLRTRQAAAIREALRWFAERPNPQTREPS